MQDWLKRVGLPYHSLHKFRHGNAVYSLKNARDISALKAVSQNLMHANLSITDGIYGIFSEEDIKAEIALLGKKIGITNTRNEDIELLLNLARKLLDGANDG